MYDLEWRSVVICGALWRGAAGYVALWRSLDGYRVLWRNVANCGALRHNQISTCLCASKRCAPVAAEVGAGKQRRGCGHTTMRTPRQATPNWRSVGDLRR